MDNTDPLLAHLDFLLKDLPLHQPATQPDADRERRASLPCHLRHLSLDEAEARVARRLAQLEREEAEQAALAAEARRRRLDVDEPDNREALAPLQHIVVSAVDGAHRSTEAMWNPEPMLRHYAAACSAMRAAWCTAHRGPGSADLHALERAPVNLMFALGYGLTGMPAIQRAALALDGNGASLAEVETALAAIQHEANTETIPAIGRAHLQVRDEAGRIDEVFGNSGDPLLVRAARLTATTLLAQCEAVRALVPSACPFAALAIQELVHDFMTVLEVEQGLQG